MEMMALKHGFALSGVLVTAACENVEQQALHNLGQKQQMSEPILLTEAGLGIPGNLIFRADSRRFS
jgi:hypothetical protein